MSDNKQTTIQSTLICTKNSSNHQITLLLHYLFKRCSPEGTLAPLFRAAHFITEMENQELSSQTKANICTSYHVPLNSPVRSIGQVCLIVRNVFYGVVLILNHSCQLCEMIEVEMERTKEVG